MYSRIAFVRTPGQSIEQGSIAGRALQVIDADLRGTMGLRPLIAMSKDMAAFWMNIHSRDSNSIAKARVDKTSIKSRTRFDWRIGHAHNSFDEAWAGYRDTHDVMYIYS